MIAASGCRHRVFEGVRKAYHAAQHARDWHRLNRARAILLKLYKREVKRG